MKKFIFCVVLMSCCIMGWVFGQSPLTEADYQRAESFSRANIQRKVFNNVEDVSWLNDRSGVVYQLKSREGLQYFILSFAKFKKTPAFNTARLADSLAKLSGQTIDAKDLHLTNMNWKNKGEFSFSYRGKRYNVLLRNYVIREENGRFRGRAGNVITSPDKRKTVYLAKNNLSIRDASGGEPVQLSQDGTPYYVYGSYYGWDQIMTGEGTPPEPHLTAEWSPDSRKILTQIMDARDAQKMYLLNWSVDTLYRPLLLSYYRASPGDSVYVKYIPVIYDVQTGKMTRINIPALPHFLGVSFRWSANGKHLYGLYYHRGYKEMEILEVDPESGAVRSVYADHNKTYIEYGTQFRYLEARGIAFVTSEKTGWNQLYRIDWTTGNTKALTGGEFVVKEIAHVDTLQNEIYFTASGKESGTNPYYDLLYKIHFDGSGLTSLTPELLNHEISFSPDGKFFIDQISSPSNPTAVVLRETKTGNILTKIDSLDITDLLKTGWKYPQLFTATARDGKTKIYGALWKPTHFDPDRSYPVIDYSYTGAQATVFPNTFSKALNSFYASAQSLAELGFIVMQVDGLGSAGRSKIFHDWSYKNMGNNLQDHVLAISQLGKKYPWFDTTRVGIFGHSAGGYDAAHALEAFNNCYKVAVSESGDHDWRMEKAWWPEMYVGWPVDSMYQIQSSVTMAPMLKGKLLLIHGGIDENVNPSATFKLSEALIKANKFFDLLIIPSARHGYPAAYQDYVTKKRWDYFVKNLIIDPPK